MSRSLVNSACVVAAWIVLCSAWWWNASGDDLASSYVASRLIAAHKFTSIYAHDARRFHVVEDPAWTEVSAVAHVPGMLHPYVQSPLWAWMLQPLASGMSFPIFGRVFLLIELIAMAATLWISARLWNADLLKPLPLSVALAALTLSGPFQYAMALLQTHVLALALTMIAVWLTLRNRPIPGGATLAVAAAMKVTPAVLAVYWLCTRRARAAVAFAVTLVIIAAASVWVVGLRLNREYIDTLDRVSKTGLVAFNNQSITAWLLRFRVPVADIFDWRVVPLPAFVRIVNMAVFALAFVAMLWRPSRIAPVDDGRYVPALLLLATISAPIAWTHYFVVMMIPAVVLSGQLRSQPSAPGWVFFSFILALQYWPIAMDPVRTSQSGNAFVSSYLLSAVLSIVILSGGARVAVDRHARRAIRRVVSSDTLVAVLCGMVVFGIYLATMYHGLAGFEEPGLLPEVQPSVDAPKFDYIGHVLGVPHNPGYPLYVMLAYLFSWIPAGSYAFRAAVMSAFFGAVTVSLVYAVVRQLDGSRLAAVCAALGFGFGRVFWAQSTIAEVYTLNAAIVAAVVTMLNRWRNHGTTSALYIAAGLFGIGLGNHTTIVLLVPGLIAAVLLADPSILRRTTVIARCVVVAGIGLLQYGFILVRTAQHAAYIEPESSAATVAGLWRTASGSQFFDRLFAYTPTAVVTERLPAALSLFQTECGSVGLVLAALGSIWLVKKRHGSFVVLVCLSVAAFVGFVVNYRAHDFYVFLIPAYLLVWVVVGAGLSALLDAGRWWSSAAIGATVLVAVMIPSSQIVGNYTMEDRHGRRYYTDYFDALFRAIPDHSILVAQQYQAEHMARYELLAGGARDRRDVQVLGRTPDPDGIRRYWSDGWTVFTFANEAQLLHSYGFRFTPVALTDPAGRTIDMAPLRLYKVARGDSAIVVPPEADVDVAAAAVDGQTSVRWTASGGDELTLDIASDVPLAPVVASIEPPAGVASRVEVSELSGHYASRISVSAATAGIRMIGLAFGDVPSSVTARIRSGRAEFWPRALRENGFFDGDAEPVSIQFGPIHEDLLGYGWYPPERDNAFDFRWTSRTEADVLVPLARPLALRVTMSAMAILGPHESALPVRLNINNIDLGPRAIGADWAESAWDVPMSCWRSGINHLVIEVPRTVKPDSIGPGSDVRTLGVAVRALTLTPYHEGP